MIIFGTNARGAGLQRIPQAGGTPAAVTTVAANESIHSRPIFLPDGRRFLFRATEIGRPERGWLNMASLDSQERRPLVEIESSNVAYSAGHLLFLRGSTLMAQPFDAARAALSGEPFPVAENLQAYAQIPVGVFSASQNGVLVYQTGDIASDMEVRWFDRDGRRGDRLGEPGRLGDLRLSRDGTRVAMSRRLPLSSPSPGADIYVIETATGQSNRLTFDAGSEFAAVFSPDGRQVVFNSSKKGSLNLYVKAADGSGGETELLVDESDKFAADWSPDGRYLLYTRGPTTPRDRPSPAIGRGGAIPGTRLWLLPMQGPRTPFPLTTDPDGSVQTPGSFSPDGRFVAYASSTSPGRPEVYVTTVPPSPARWQISTEGGVAPRWSEDGSEIYFMRQAPTSSVLMAARVDAKGAAVRRLDVRALFATTPAGARSTYAVSRDGQRFLVITPVGSGAPATAAPTIVLDWLALRKPAG